MKFAKKIFVGIVAVALLVSCFAFSTSAEAPTRPVENFESVLEYRDLSTYLIENYENYEEGAFAFVSKSSHFVDKDVFTFVMSEGATEEIKLVGENKMLSITNSSSAPVGYKFLAESEDDMLPRIVMSFDFKSGDGTVGGSDVVVFATLCDYFDDVPLFAANLAGEEKSFTYATYNSNRVTYSAATADAAPALNTWYTVNIVYDLENGKLAISVLSEGEEVFSHVDEIAATEGIDSIRFYCKNAEEETGVTFIDNFTAYDGSVLRDAADPENALADLLIAIDAYAKDPLTPIKEKLEVREAYLMLYGEDEGASYVVPEGIKNYEKMCAVVADVPGFRNRTLADAFIASVDTLVATEGYYTQIEYRDTVVDEYYAMYDSDDASDYEGKAGMTDKYNDDLTYAEAIVKARKDYAGVNEKLAEVKRFSEDFAKQIEEGYDPDSKNYEEMLSKYNLLSLTASKIDLGYRYSDVNPNTKYPTIADAYAEYLALEAKLQSIENNVKAFVPAVLAMDITEAESVSAENPYLTVNFESLYENYLIANALYKNGTVNANLDPATFVSSEINLPNVIAEFEAKKEYVEARIAECNAFLSIINGADVSNYFVTVVSELERAALYLDSDKEYSLEKYAGVEEAVALYTQLLLRVEKNRTDAANYIAAVGEIDLEASYTALRAKVDAAVLLQADGSVTGIEGVEAADIKLAQALSKVETLEGYSKTLISSVASLKNAKTLAERRALIFTALSVKDEAETSISGVNAAKTDLNSEIQKYNAEVEALNALFGSVCSDAAIVITSAVADAGVAGAAEAIDKLN